MGAVNRIGGLNARFERWHLAGRCSYPNCPFQPDLVDQAQAMSNKRLDTVSALARHGYALSVECLSCGHMAKLDARAISEEATRRNLSREIEAVERRLKCGRCGERNVRCGPAFA